MPIKPWTVGALLALGMGVSACATGESLEQTAPSITPVASDMSRIVVYRTQIIGAAVQPKILIDDEETDRCQPN